MITIDDTELDCIPERDEYTLHKTGRKPKVVIGYKLETKYDHERHHISESVDPQRIRFLSKDFNDVNEWYYVYGVVFDPTSDIQHLFHSTLTVEQLDVDMYYDFLKLFDFTCEDNYLLARKNVYVLDSRHIPHVTHDQYTSYATLKEVMISNDVSFYQNCDALKIFLIL